MEEKMTADKNLKRLIVVGGGIAGLAAAYYAQKKCREAGLPVQISILEAEDRWGGKILTERMDGFVVEGGPDTFLATKPWGVGLSRELGLGERLQGTNPHQKNTYVLNKGQLRPLPEGLMMMIPSRFGPVLRSGLLSWPAKARLGLDFVLPAKRDGSDESLGTFVSRRLGRQAYENLIEPLMSGIYAGDGDQLSLQSTFPYLHDLERKYGGLGKGVLAMRKKLSQNGKSAPGSRSAFLTPTSGLAEIVEALVEVLSDAGVELLAGMAIEKIVKDGELYRLFRQDGRVMEAEAVILAAPAYASGAMVEEIDRQLSEELKAIQYATTATVSMAFRQEDLVRPLDGYGYVIPRREGREALACTWTSTKFPHRAPEGSALLRVFVGRAGQEADIVWNEESLIRIAREELRKTLGIQAEPILTRVHMWERAMPQYNLGHPARLERIDKLLQEQPGLFLAGNGYRGIGIPDCIHSGEIAALAALEGLGSEGQPEGEATPGMPAYRVELPAERRV
jgi:protoporphyrinogen/coproporphyrinogen III oxidase